MTEESEEEFGPATFGNTDVDEADTQDVLTSVIDSRYIKLTFETRDKYPNRDGLIEIANDRGEPIGDVVIQVKKLAERKRDPPKFQCPRHLLEYSRAISPPLILLGVDTKKQVVYWKHISPNWVDNLELRNQKSKVIHVSEENIVDGLSKQYISDWQQIAAQNKQRIWDYDEFEQLKEVTNPALGESRPEFENIHRYLDKYNSLVHGDFSIIKERFYPRLWKFGYANVEYSDDSACYGLYPITWDTNDVQIKDVELTDEFTAMTKYDLSMLNHCEHDPFFSSPEDRALQDISSRLVRLVSDKWLKHFENDFICRELIFEFIDRYDEYMGLEEKRVYKLNELETGFYQYLQLWIDEAIDRIDDPESVSERYYDLPLFTRFRQLLSSSDRTEIHEAVKELVNDGVEPQFKYNFSTRLVSSRLVDEALTALGDRGVDEVKAPHPAKNAEPPVETTRQLYSDEDIVEYVEEYWRNLVDGYQAIAEASFPDLSDMFTGFDEVDVIMVEVDPVYRGDRVKSGYSQRFLEKEGGDDGESDVLIYVHRMDSQDDYLIDHSSLGETVMFQGEEYRFVKSVNGMLQSLFGRKDVMDEVYRRIKDDLDEYFADVPRTPIGD